MRQYRIFATIPTVEYGAKNRLELFRYRRKQPWLSLVVKSENWDVAYASQKGNLDVLPTVDEAIAWANELIEKIDKAP